MSHNQTGRWQVIGPVLILVGLCLFVMGTLLYSGIVGQNALILEKEKTVARTAIDMELSALGSLCSDYAWWNEAYVNLIADLDPTWANNNIGSYLHQHKGIDLSAAIRPDGTVAFSMVRGQEGTFDPGRDMPKDWAVLARTALDAPIDEAKPSVGIIEWQGIPWLVAVTRFTTEDAAEARLGRRDRGWLLLGRAMDERFIKTLAERFGLRDGRMVSSAPAAGAFLTHDSPSREQTWYLAWQPSRPGDALLHQLSPAIGLSFLVITSLGVYILIVWRREWRLRETSNQVLYAVLDNAADSVLSFDGSGRLLSANLAASRLFGLPAERLLEKPVGALFRSEANALSAIADAAVTRRTVGPLFARTAAGRVVPLEVRPSRAGEDAAPIYTVILRDISQQQEIAAQLKEARSAAEAAHLAKRRFIATISHELRTPLTSIIGFSELIVDRPPGDRKDAENVRTYAGFILDSGRHLLCIINDILDLATVDAGVVALQHDMIDLRILTEECRAAVSQSPTGMPVEIVNAIASEAPLIEGDEGMIRKMLAKLLSNAIKFSADGGTVTVLTTSSTDGCLRIMVVDQGVGIPPDRLKAVTQPFSQSEDVLRRHVGGTGLGLALTRAYIEAHGGSIEIESRAGQGTRVSLLFPADRVHPRNRNLNDPVPSRSEPPRHTGIA